MPLVSASQDIPGTPTGLDTSRTPSALRLGRRLEGSSVSIVKFATDQMCFGNGCGSVPVMELALGPWPVRWLAPVRGIPARPFRRSVGPEMAECSSAPAAFGVICSPGYTLCQPNAVCTNVSNDVNNCGTCGHVCPGGYSCQGGSCIAPPPPPPATCAPGYFDCMPRCVKPPQSCG
jgi:hypothetical protein